MTLKYMTCMLPVCIYFALFCLDSDICLPYQSLAVSKNVICEYLKQGFGSIIFQTWPILTDSLSQVFGRIKLLKKGSRNVILFQSSWLIRDHLEADPTKSDTIWNIKGEESINNASDDRILVLWKNIVKTMKNNLTWWIRTPDLRNEK